MLSAVEKATRGVVLAGLVALTSAASVAISTAAAGASTTRGQTAMTTAAVAPAPAADSTSYRHGLVPAIGAAPAPAPATVPAPGSAAAARAPRPTPAAAQPAVASEAAPPGNVAFGGGTNGVGVTTGAPKVYLVFWGSLWGTQSTNAQGDATFSGDPKAMAPLLQEFMKGLGTGSETWSGVMTQYCEGVASGAQSCPTDAAHVGYPTGGALAGVWHDTAGPPVLARPSELAAEAVKAADHFGNTTQASNRDAQYFVISPSGSNPDGFNFNRSPQFCGWHDVSNDPALADASLPLAVAFTNMPYVPDAGGACGAGFVNGGSAGTLDGVTIVAGNEYAATITDRFAGGGWRDSAGNENGDKCAWIPAGSGQGAAQNINLTTGRFAVQSTWANDFDRGNGGCEVAHSIVVNHATSAAPAVTSAQDVSLVTGIPLSFTVSTTGFPAPALSYTGSLPTGVTFADNHDGSAAMAGSPAAGTAGVYPVTVTATNSVGNTAGQDLTITVNEYGTIVNFAGDPSARSGATGDGGAANAATLYSPQGVGVDAAGNVYIADFYNFSVRKVDPEGTITNFAGAPHPFCCPRSSGDGGPATAALLNPPSALAVDPAGNVYIADGIEARVRKVDTRGVITNFAGSPIGDPGDSGDGGPATSARLGGNLFGDITGLAADRSGNVYIVSNSRVRKVGAGGIITAFAGTAGMTFGNGGDGGPAISATFRGLVDVAVDSSGNVFLTDSGNARVRKVDTRGIITNFAGSADASRGNTGDGGPAVSAAFRHPRGATVDSAGNVYIVDADNPYPTGVPAPVRVRKVDGGGIITNFAGSVARTYGDGGDGGPAISATFSSDVNSIFGIGLAVDRAGDVYIVDSAENRVREVLATTAPPIVSAASAMCTVAVACRFTVTTSVLPAPTVVESGALPSGVTFDSATRRLSGTPSRGTTGTYQITFRATNDDGTAATQSFTLTINEAPSITSAASATFTAGLRGSFTVTTTGDPAPTVSLGGWMMPSRGLTFDPATATLSGTPDIGVSGTFAMSVVATNAIGTATQSLTLTINSTSGPVSAAFTAGVPGSFTVADTGVPAAKVSLTGSLPLGLAFNAATATVSGTAAQGAVGTYPISVVAANAAGTATQNLNVTVDQATLTYPASGQTGVDTTLPFTWSTIPQAQNYILLVGTTHYGYDLVNSGILPPTQSRLAVPALPAGRTLYATLFSKVKGAWTSVQAITFMATAGQAMLTYPVDGQSGIDATQPFTWAGIPNAQDYILVVGTTRNGTDLVNSGILPPTQSSLTVPAMPAGRTLYATLLTKVNGTWSRYQGITFTAGPARANLTHPVNGQTGVANPGTFTWTAGSRAQNYYLVVGTTPNGTDLVNSGVLAPTQSSFEVPALPRGHILYATMLTEVNGVWVFQAVSFSPG
jgi:serine protease